MCEMENSEIHRDLGRIEGRVTALENSYKEMTHRLHSIEGALEEIKQLISKTRGGWQALTIMGGLAATVGGMAVAVWEFIKRGAQ